MEELLQNLSDQNQHEFISEILNCLKVKAHRGTIVLTWILTLDYLQKYVINNCLSKFNSIIQGTKKYKNIQITKQEDFEEIQDKDFLLTIRTCGMISSTELKILENRLDERNRYAHPTNIRISEQITNAFIEDLLLNIVPKFKQ